MVFNPLTGVNGNVAVGLVSYTFGKWKLGLKNKLQDVSNFLGAGYGNVRPGVNRATLTLESLAYDAGNMSFSIGVAYTFTLNYNAIFSTAITIYIESIDTGSEYDGSTPLTISGQSDGPFTPGIS